MKSDILNVKVEPEVKKAFVKRAKKLKLTVSSLLYRLILKELKLI